MSEFESADFTSTDAGKAEREGLPSGYRMRADPHYVELLSGPPRVERARDPVRHADANDASLSGAHDRRLLDQLTEDVAAIESAAALLAADRSPLARRVGLDLIKAQAARASWLLRANALIHGGDADAVVRRRPIGALLSQIRERAAVECRLVGIGLVVEATDAAAVVAVADATVSAGLTGAVMAQLGLLAGTEGGVIRLYASVAEGELVSVDIAQDVAPLPPNAHARFFDIGWVTRPGGWLAAMGAATAQVAAERLGGRATIVPGDRRGCTIRWVLSEHGAEAGATRL